MKIIVLAGGKGTRLFPLSREQFPKQFLTLNNKTSLIQKTVNRYLKVAKEEDLLIVSQKEYAFYIKHQLRHLNKYKLIIEPSGKDTGPAIALAVKYALDVLKVPIEEILFVSPADHIIHPEENLLNKIDLAKNLAAEGYIVTFGILPQKPETGYGYIEVDSFLTSNVYKVKKFHEKPDLETAKLYLSKGNYYWNSGIFVFSIETILNEFKKNAPVIFDAIKNSTYEEFLSKFLDLPKLSIDYAVMEKTQNAILIPLDIYWSDIGSWDSLYDFLKKDKEGNVKIGNVFTLETKNSLIWSSKRLITTLGIENLIVIETDDVVLVVPREKSQNIKNLVEELKKNPKTNFLTKIHKEVCRPWGSYKELEKSERYKIKKITVNPGEMLSLQLHYHRSEHWVVVKGTAKVILEDEKGHLKEILVTENESIYVPKTRKHRISNPGKVPLEIIEIQVGEYLEEDDIIRFEDKYNRL